MIKPIKVLIVDDSPLMRKLISSLFKNINAIEVVGTAMNGIFALQKLGSLKPDVIILDIEMPYMNGIEFLKEKKKLKDYTPVIILSSLAHKGAKITMQALSLGAMDFILKPSDSVPQEIHKVREHLIQLVYAYGRKKQKKDRQSLASISIEDEKKAPTPSISPKPITPIRKPGEIEIVTIGISTGGPRALRSIFKHLIPTISVPIIVVQHMPPGFIEEFAISLNKICALEVKQAQNGDILTPGRVLIAPADYHIEVENRPLARIIKLSNSKPVNGHRPSVGVLFLSIATLYKNHCMAIIMTGMGKDGAEEIGSIYKEGGLTIAQDRETSIIFGMPRVAINKGYIHKVVSLKEIPEIINNVNN